MPSGRDIEAVYWKKQKFQRNAIRRGLRYAVPDDLVLLSDLDEIPRASAVESVARHAGPPTVFSFEMSDHRLYVNLGRKNSWNKARMARFGDIRTLEKLRAGGPTWWPKQRRVFATLRQWKRMSLGMRRLRPWVVIRDSGWHFSYMNGPEVLADKFQAVSAVRSDSQVNPAALSLKIKDALASAARPNQEAGFHLIEDNGEFPAHLAANQARFSNLIADRQTFEYYGVEPPPIATSGSNGQRTPADRPS